MSEAREMNEALCRSHFLTVCLQEEDISSFLVEFINETNNSNFNLIFGGGTKTCFSSKEK